MLSFFSRVGHRFVSAVKRHRTPKRIVAILAEFKGNSWTLEGLCVLQINDAGTSSVLQVSPYSIIDSTNILHLPRFDEEFVIPINDCTTFSKIQNRLVICQAFRAGFVDYGIFFFTDHDCLQFWDRISAAEDRFTEMNPPPCAEMKTPAPFSSPLQRAALLNVLPHEARSYCLMSSSVNHQFTPERFTRGRSNTACSQSQPSSTTHASSPPTTSSSSASTSHSAHNAAASSSSSLATNSSSSSSNLSTPNAPHTTSSHTSSPPPLSNPRNSPTQNTRRRSSASRRRHRLSVSTANSVSHSMYVTGNSFPDLPSHRVVRSSQKPVGASPLSTKLTVSSALRFPSIRANIAVTEGRWYYEVELRTDELMQVGWASCHSFYPKVRGFGVGDDEFSWSFDGYRQLRWGIDAGTFSSINSSSDPSSYGTQQRPWRSGDRVGVSIDLKSSVNKITFYVNGVSLGAAFEDFDIAPNRSSTSSRGHGYGVSPAVSLSDHQSLTFVFERDFLKHLPSGYEPLQDVRGELRSCLLAFSDVADDVASIIIDFCPI